MGRITAITATALLATAIAAPAANAATANPQVAIRITPTAVNLQNPPTAVTVNRVARNTPITVNWGDGISRTQKTKCSVATANKKPKTCSVHLAHYYNAAGPFTITVTAGKKTIATRTFALTDPNVTPAPAPAPAPNGGKQWTQPLGWVQPAGWTSLYSTAVYKSCSTVNWYWDRTGEPANSNRVHDTVQPALDMLSKETGLRFVETTDPNAAQLAYNWSTDVDTRYPGAAAYGGGNYFTQRGHVTISPTHWWNTNDWLGLGMVTQPNGEYAGGNGWLIIHETMHVLGLGHVNDPAQVMNPVIQTMTFGAGDLDGLHTMYLNQCR